MKEGRDDVIVIDETKKSQGKNMPTWGKTRQSAISEVGARRKRLHRIQIFLRSMKVRCGWGKRLTYVMSDAGPWCSQETRIPASTNLGDLYAMRQVKVGGHQLVQAVRYCSHNDSVSCITNMRQQQKTWTRAQKQPGLSPLNIIVSPA